MNLFKQISDYLEQNIKVRIGIAFAVLIIIIAIFAPNNITDEDLYQIQKQQDWEKLFDKSVKKLEKDPSNRAYAYSIEAGIKLWSLADNLKDEIEWINELQEIEKSFMPVNDSNNFVVLTSRNNLKELKTAFKNYLNLKNDSIALQQMGWEYKRFVLPQGTAAARIVQHAKKLLGSPYKDRGKTPAGFDCSGFNRYVFAKVGLDIPAGAQYQVEMGYNVPINDAKPADLIFFGNANGVNHTGIVVDVDSLGVHFIHASNNGVVETVEKSEEWTGYWQPKFKAVKRILN